jgi:hypothetical protein
MTMKKTWAAIALLSSCGTVFAQHQYETIEGVLVGVDSISSEKTSGYSLAIRTPQGVRVGLAGFATANAPAGTGLLALLNGAARNGRTVTMKGCVLKGENLPHMTAPHPLIKIEQIFVEGYMFGGFNTGYCYKKKGARQAP